jgi:uncharacterized damage-inducible protein DinB
MKILVFVALACGAVFSLAAQTPPPAKQTESPATKEIREEFYAVTNNIRHAADKMPESGYSFKPAPGMRSFGEVIAHVADVQSKTCGSMLRDKKPVPSIPGTAKADLAKTLAASFDECYEAFSELSAQNQNEMVPTPAGQRARIAALTMVLSHNNEEYGYMAVYLRLKGVVPPSTSETGAREYKAK